MKHATTRRAQRGAAALIVTLLLFLALALLALGLQRHLRHEQRGATQQARAAQAFEAAEAGLAWLQAQLNDTRPVDAACAPATAAEAQTLRARSLVLDRASGTVTPTAALVTACTRVGGAWSCRCDRPATASTSSAESTAFAITLQAAPRAGTVRVVASGATGDASARTEATLALHPGLSAAPAAAITTRDATPQTADQFFVRWFGTDKASWRDQPAAARMTCSAACGRDIETLVGAGHALVWIDGDATLAGPLVLGTPERPIVLVASGALRLDGGVAIHGVAYAAAVTLAGSDNLVRGAVFSESGYAGPTEPAVIRDADVLAGLRHQTGSFVRVPGSWRDF